MCVQELLADIADGYIALASMVLVSTLLPFQDCTLTAVEGLAVMISDCSECARGAGQQQQIAAKESFLTHHLLQSTQEDMTGGHIIMLLSALVIRCQLPADLLPPTMKLTVEPLQPVCRDPLKGLVGYGCLSPHCGDDNGGFIENTVAMRCVLHSC